MAILFIYKNPSFFFVLIDTNTEYIGTHQIPKQHIALQTNRDNILIQAI